MIAVLGAGPAGASAAIAARRAGVAVKLIDRGPRTGFKAGESLPPVARPLLRRLGVWDDFLAGGHRPCWGNASAWGSDVLRHTDFLYDPHGSGWHLDRARFDEMLRAAALRAGAEYAGDATGADWVIDCTGRKSWFARQRGVERRVFDSLLSHVAVLANQDQEAVTLVESVCDGWWYTAPIPDARRVVAYQTKAGSVTDTKARTPQGFRELLAETRHVSQRVGVERGPVEWLHGPAAQPANTVRLKTLAGEGWMAAGDAAFAIDPLSSHGIVHALQSGWGAGVAAAATLGGDATALPSYVHHLEQDFKTYLDLRLGYYALETRWMDHPFWALNSFAFSGGIW